jgi:hypothetical protein
MNHTIRGRHTSIYKRPSLGCENFDALNVACTELEKYLKLT